MPGKINSLTEKEQAKWLENKYNIGRIMLHEDVQHKCPLGEQVGVTHYEIEVQPNEHLAELIALHWDIQDMMGKTFTLESGAAQVLEKVKKAYVDPCYIKVVASCGTNRHMAVDVELEWADSEDLLANADSNLLEFLGEN